MSCTDDALDDRLQAMISGLLPHAALVGQIHINNSGGLLSTWVTLRAAAGAAATSEDAKAVTRRAGRVTLQVELFKNLLTLALNFPNDLSNWALYCPQPLLMPPNLPLPGLVHGQCGVERRREPS